MTQSSKTTIMNNAEFIQLVQQHVAANDVWTTELVAANVTHFYQKLLADEKQLERILIARKYNAEKSLDLFLDQVRFRTKVPTVLPSDIPNALPSGAWRMMGYAKDGSPISNYRLEHWNPHEWTGTLDETVVEYTKYVVYMIELMIASMKEDQLDKFTVLFDLQGFYFTMVTERNRNHMIRKLIYVAQTQYPERLERVLLVNAPYGFQTAWALINPLLDAKTASKIKFVSHAQLLDDIDKSVLAEDYGGTHATYAVPVTTIHEEAITSREK